MKAELDPSSADSPQRLTIETMSTSDVTDVTRIERQSFTTTWPADAFYNEINTNKLAHYFVGRIGSKVVAYGGIWVIFEDSHVTTIAVDDAHRGRKYGELMLLHLIDEALERGAAWMTLEVRERNVVAQQLYRKYGFTTVTTRKAYYSDNNENALVMWAGNLKGDLYGARIRALRARFAR
ncbi:MAG: ribosomal protein S18-alanine N-acetyltransferase [Candidatus Eremiobacteraeota bacterium]|nr:ribosomal protein S18-alanine N-acetyltransferase [Candidatus Eremiobacteraeota bacterium]